MEKCCVFLEARTAIYLDELTSFYVSVLLHFQSVSVSFIVVLRLAFLTPCLYRNMRVGCPGVERVLQVSSLSLHMHVNARMFVQER
jgi:hypothetical protein